MRKLLLILPLLSLLPLSATARAEDQSPEDNGLAIAIEADQRDQGWSDSRADMKMILRNAQGETSEREIRVRTLEVEDDGDKSLIIFDNPADVAGTAFLSYTHAIEPDDQWLYLPALKRVKRIASANKSGPFMGSEFAFEDISSQEVEKYSYRWLRNEKLDGRECFVLERIPRYQHSGYTRQVAWIDKAEYRPQKVEYYDRKGAHLKTLTFHEYQEYQDQYWRAHRLEMVNHLNGKSTTLTWSGYEFGNGFTDRDFDRNTLKRVR